MKTIPVPIMIKNGVSAAPDFLMALMFLVTWIEPEALGDNMVSYLALVLLLEFIIIHSTVFMGFTVFGTSSKKTKIVSLLGFGAFYSIFIIAFSLIYGQWWPLLVFVGMVLNRMLSVIVGNETDQNSRMIIGKLWMISVFCYVMGVFIALALPLPRFGITEAYILQSSITKQYLWFDEPHKLLAFGFLYFTVVSQFELWLDKWVNKKKNSAY